VNLSAEDSPFLDDFGEDLTTGAGATLRVQLAQPYARTLGISGRQVIGTVEETAAAGLAVGDVLERTDGERLEIAAVRPARDLGRVELQLTSLGYTVTVPSGALLRSLFIDAAYPAYPIAAPPGVHDEDKLLLRGGASPCRPILLIGALAPTYLPAHARIDQAELWAYGVEAAAGPSWSTHRILQRYLPGAVSWLQYRTRGAWSQAGCSAAGVDYLAAGYGTGTEITEEAQRLAWGRAFTRAVDAAKSSGLGLIVRNTAGTDTARLWNGSVADAELRPYLVLHYSLPVG